MKMLRVLKQPHIALLWGSQVLSSWGNELFLLAIMWIAVQQLGNAAGIVTAAGSLSSLAVGLFYGILVDRWNPRFTMMTVDFVRALAVISLPLFFVFGGLQIWQLIIVTVIVETLDMLFDPSMQVSLPILIKDMHLLHATNALMDASRRVSRILGPGLAGIFLLFLPMIHFFTIDAVSFFISASAIYVLKHRFVQKPEAISSKRIKQESFVVEMRSGFDLVCKSRPLVWALIALVVGNLAWGTSFIVGVPLLTSHVLGATIGDYGLIVGAFGIGNILSTLWIGNLTIRHHARFMFTGRIVLGIGYLVIAGAGTVWVALLGAAIAALGGPMGEIPFLTIIQTKLPSEYIGKISSLRITIATLGFTLGVLLSSPLFLLLNTRLAIAAFPVLLIAIGIFCLLRFANTPFTQMRLSPTGEYPPDQPL